LDGDVIDVCAGTYGRVEVIGTDVSIVGRDGIEAVVVDGDSLGGVSIFGAEVTLEGMTITGDVGSSKTSALEAESSVLRLLDLRVAEAEAGSGSYTIHIEESDSEWDSVTVEENQAYMHAALYGSGSHVIRRTIFRDNDGPSGTGSGGLIMQATSSADLEFTNNLVMSNVADNVEYLFGAFATSGEIVRVHNNVFADNNAGSGATALAYGGEWKNNIVAFNTGSGVSWDSSRATTIEYNDVYGNSKGEFLSNGSPSATNLELEPRFVDSRNGDYHLEAGFSPCIDAGDPLSGYDDPDGTRNDMGAYGGPEGSW
jgi:hypothetical protein